MIRADSSKSSKLLVRRGTKWGAAETRAWGKEVGVRERGREEGREGERVN